MEELTSWNDFAKLDIRAGTVVAVNDFARAQRPSYRLSIDFGDLGIKKSSAQLTNYSKDELLGSQVIAVVNFPPKNIAGFWSACLVLGVYGSDGKVTLLQPKSSVANGCKIG